jgi:predicted permease
LRSFLIVAQVSASFILLIGAGLMLRSLVKLQNVNTGFSPERVLVMSLNPNWSKYHDEQFRIYFQQVIDKVKSEPGIESVAAGTSYPLNAGSIFRGPSKNDFEIEGESLSSGQLPPSADDEVVSTNYFQTLNIPLVNGRFFKESDDKNAPNVAIINQSMARHRWPNSNPVGSRVTFDKGVNWIEIVGVVGDVKQFGLNQTPFDQIYGVLAQNTFANDLLVRTPEDPTVVFKRLRNVIHAVDPETAITDELTLEQVKDESLASQRLTTILLGLFAFLAILITAAGIAGVMALSVSQRTHELGVRMALGASQTDVLKMVLGQGMTLVAIGLCVGFVGAIAVTKLMSNLLFAVTPTDPATFLSVSIVLIVVAATAAIIPASRVTSIDPMTALRTE